MKLTIQELKLLKNTNYLALRSFVSRRGNGSSPPESLRDLPQTGTLVAKIDAVIPKIVGGIEEICKVWYKEVPGSLPEDALLESYRLHFREWGLQAATLLRDLPAFVRDILAFEDEILKAVLESKPENIGLSNEIHYPVQAILSQWEGYLYWLALLKSDLKDLEKDSHEFS